MQRCLTGLDATVTLIYWISVVSVMMVSPLQSVSKIGRYAIFEKLLLELSEKGDLVNWRCYLPGFS